MQYNSYLERGKVSTVDALEIGVAIEERDISELETILDSESELPTDIKNVYSNLLNGELQPSKGISQTAREVVDRAEGNSISKCNIC